MPLTTVMGYRVGTRPNVSQGDFIPGLSGPTYQEERFCSTGNTQRLTRAAGAASSHLATMREESPSSNQTVKQESGTGRQSGTQELMTRF